MEPWASKLGCERTKVEIFEYWMYNKNDYYCIDGFPQEGFPCVVVLPPPYRQGYVYQGIKPAVLPVTGDAPEDEEAIKQHVRVKQEEILEKIKAKRQLSLQDDEEDKVEQEEEVLQETPQDLIKVEDF